MDRILGFEPSDGRSIRSETTHFRNALVAKLAKAPHFLCGYCGFESRREYEFSP